MTKKKNRYLTVQDLLWINLQVTGTVNAYRFNLLEDGCNFQYGYGSSQNLPAQALGFLRGFGDKAPFTKGNRATAFVGFVSFLALNGYGFRDSGHALWKTITALGDGAAGASHLATLLVHHDDHEPEPTRVVVGRVLAENRELAATLIEAEHGRAS